MSALLEARSVSKAFAGVRAVVDASLAVEPASITALIGPTTDASSSPDGVSTAGPRTSSFGPVSDGRSRPPER